MKADSDSECPGPEQCDVAVAPRPVYQTAVTHHGFTKAGQLAPMAYEHAMRVKERVLFLRQHEVEETFVEVKGRAGTGYEFKRGVTKAYTTVRASGNGWGFRHNRFDSLWPDWYIAFVHMHLAEHQKDCDPDCKHATHGSAGHVCNAFTIAGQTGAEA